MLTMNRLILFLFLMVVISCKSPEGKTVSIPTKDDTTSVKDFREFKRFITNTKNTNGESDFIKFNQNIFLNLFQNQINTIQRHLYSSIDLKFHHKLCFLEYSAP